MRGPLGLGLLAVLTCLSAGCCCPSGSSVHAADTTALLRIETVPPTEVWIDGTSRGLAPLEVELASGPHEVLARLAGFEDARLAVDLAPGRELTKTLRLRLSDIEDRQALQLLADAYDLWLEPFEQPQAHRGDAPAAAARLVYPRGALRPDDLSEFRIDFTGSAKAPGWVRFAKGGDVFYEKQFDAPDTGVLIRALPADVASNVAKGDKVTWGFHPEEGEPVLESFAVVDTDVTAVVNAMKKGLASQPKAAVVHLIAQVYSDAGLHFAAHQYASKAIRGGQGSLRSWAVVLSALERMGSPKHTLAYRQAQKQVSAFSALQGSEVFFQPDYPVRKLLQHIEAGRAGRALLDLKKDRIASLAQNPTQSRAVARQAARQARFMAARSPAATRKVAAAVLKMAEASQAQAPDDPQTAWSLGFALLHKARVGRALDPKPAPAAWIAAAEALLRAYDAGLDDDGLAFATAVGWLREAMALKGADVADLEARCDDIAERAEKRFPKSPYAAGARASAHMGRASRGSRRQAREKLEAAFEALAPHVGQADVPPFLKALHAEAVTLDLTRKAGTKTEYRLARHDSLDFLVQLEVPDTPRWVVRESPPEGFILRVEQYGSDEDLLRVITVRTAAAGVGYLLASGRQVDGDNVGRLARFDLEETERAYRKVKGRPRSTKRRLSSAFRPGYGYDMEGDWADGTYRRTRSWFTKSGERKLTYLITITEFADLGKDGPELEVVLDSLREKTTGAR